MTGRDDLGAPFGPRLARRVSLGLALVVALATVALVVALPMTSTDRVGFLLFAAGVCWFCWRQASVRALPDDGGLTVRNLLVTTRLEWADVVAVRFGDGRPWVQLDLANGDTLAVMAVQRADGAFGEQEARRLATLVAARTRTERDD